MCATREPLCCMGAICIGLHALITRRKRGRNGERWYLDLRNKLKNLGDGHYRWCKYAVLVRLILWLYEYR